MSEPCIVSVAITGSVPRKADNPAVPITVAEQVESTHAAFEAGAALVHIHVRNDDETPSSDLAKFALSRLVHWIGGEPLAPTRRSHFSRLVQPQPTN